MRSSWLCRFSFIWMACCGYFLYLDLVILLMETVFLAATVSQNTVCISHASQLLEVLTWKKKKKTDFNVMQTISGPGSVNLHLLSTSGHSTAQ